LRDISGLGPRLSGVISASFAAARQVDIAQILTRNGYIGGDIAP
jgi:hypothetical protein